MKKHILFIGVDIFEFFAQFSSTENCLAYLADTKWRAGYTCLKCNNKSYSKTKKPYERKCNKCKYKETATANTLFHKVKFDLRKAFYIVFIMSTSKKSCSSEEFSRKLSLSKNACWLFQHKVRQAMKSSKKYPITTKAIVDEFVVGGKEKGKQGKRKTRKK